MIRQVAVLVVLFLFMGVLPNMSGSLPPFSPIFTSTVLGFIILASLFIGKLTGKYGLPMITGYLLAGIIFGPDGLRLFSQEDIGRLQFVNSMALTLIALSAGAELHWQSLTKRLSKIIWITSVQMGVVFVGVTGILWFILAQGYLTGLPPEMALYGAMLLGIVATANSPSSVVAIIGETGARGKVAQTVLSVSVIKDVLVIAAFGLIASYIQNVSGSDSSIGAVDILAHSIREILLSSGTGLLIGLVVLALIKWFGSPRELFTIGLAVFCSELSSGFNLDPLILSILVGFMIRNLSPKGEEFIKMMERGSLPIFVTFFSMAGASLDMAGLRAMLPLAIGYFSIRMFLVYASTTAAAAVAKEKPMPRKHLWTGFTAQAGVSLGLAALINDGFGEYGHILSGLILASVALNQLVGPVLFKYSLQACGETGKSS